MLAANCIQKSELPDFDEETGVLPKEESDEEDVEIEIVEEEPPFLQGHGSKLHDLSPVSILFAYLGVNILSATLLIEICVILGSNCEKS